MPNVQPVRCQKCGVKLNHLSTGILVVGTPEGEKTVCTPCAASYPAEAHKVAMTALITGSNPHA